MKPSKLKDNIINGNDKDNYRCIVCTRVIPLWAIKKARKKPAKLVCTICGARMILKGSYLYLVDFKI